MTYIFYTTEALYSLLNHNGFLAWIAFYVGKKHASHIYLFTSDGLNNNFCMFFSIRKCCVENYLLWKRF